MRVLVSVRTCAKARLAVAAAIFVAGTVVGLAAVPPSHANEFGALLSKPASETRNLPPAADRPKAPGLRGTVLGFRTPKLAYRDKLATLEAVQVALSEVEDGTNYVWYRPNGHLSGIVRPIRSFADERGRICRSIRVMLRAGVMTRTVQGDACRDVAGRWSLERAQATN